jgi:beta-lactamase class A
MRIITKIPMRIITKILAPAIIFSCLLINPTHATLKSATLKLEELRKQLDSIAERVNGKVGYSLHHLKKNETLDRFGDELFPTDSTLKVAIMCAAMERVERGEIGYYNIRPLLEEDQTPGSGFFQHYKAGTEVEFKELMHQMIAVSDNTATLMIMRWMGGTEVTNKWLDRLGLKNTRLLQPWPISEDLQRDEAALQKIVEPIKKWGMGVSTPNEMRTLMELIVNGKAGTPAASDEMHRLLNHQYYDEGIASQIPPWVAVASKSGRSQNSQSDIAIVHSPSGTYTLTVFSKEAKDTRRGLQNEQKQAIRAISRAVWRYYHPNDNWSPPAGVEKF